MLWSPFEQRHLRDPYPMYARLRNEDPVHRSQTGEFIVTRYNDVKSILRSPDFRSGNRLEWLARGIEYFKNHDEDLGNIYRAINSFILFMNAPDHAAIRNFVSRTWDDRDVELMITSVVDDHLNKLNGTFDLVKDFARPVPATIISKIMGLPPEEFEYLRGLGINMVRSLDLYHSWKDLVELNESAGAFVKYFDDFIQKTKNKPNDGLVSKLLIANNRDRILRDEQMISIAIFLFIAGKETSANSIGTALYDLMQQPAIYKLFRDDVGLFKTTGIDEFFRFDGPVHLLGRISKTDTLIGNTTIPANSPVTLAVAAANRDELAFLNPDQIDPYRTPNQHLAFGYGTHFCLGEWLGKLQTRIAVERFIMKFPEAKVVTKNIEWIRNISVRGMTSLIVKTI
jgi:pimeloyl-[acyl-carrier protein] synthase